MSASPPPTDELPAVFRNPDGTVGFPSVVPPQVDFPVASPGKTEEPTGGEVRLSRGILTPGTGGASVEAEANGDEDAPTLKLKASEEDSQTQRGEEGRELSPVRTGQADGPEANRTPAMTSRIQSARQISELEGTVPEQPHVQGLTSNQSLPRESEEGDEEEKWPRRWIPGQKGPVRDVESLKSATNRQKTKYGKFALGNGTLSMDEKVSKDDGRLDISVSEKTKTGYLAKALGVSFMKRLGHAPEGSAEEKGEYEKRAAARGRLRRRSSDTNLITKERKVRMNIVIMVIGSRGDIQPFLKIGKILKEEYGHRVRIATHPAFRDFVEHDTDLEFFSVGGDPAELMAFMVKNPGMIPSLATLKTGEIGKRRDAMAQMFQGFWRACINTTDDEHDVHNLKVMGGREPFIADAIIANPPSFAHIHCAERLGIPLHLMFTFPYTPTQAFPHPLANIKRTNVDPGYANFMSYMLVELMTWQGLGDLVNDFRVKTLGLEPVSTLWAPGQLYRLRVPYTYLWSPGLVPKPKDWGPEIDIAGFVFLDLASSFTPPDSLVKFLEAGPPPVYIGFGSIVVDDPNKFTKMIYEAVEMAGVRALVSKGWGGFGGDDSPDNVYMLGNTPHDWLFPKVQAVVHHGGAGTTAIGLKCGKPTLVVPFFGDQFFWGNMIGKAGAGSMPIPYKQLTAANLAEGIKKLLEPETQEHASLFAKRIEREGDGAQNAVVAFHRCLSVRGEQSMRCSILPDQLAVWALKTTNVRLSALAADILVAKRKVQWRQLRLLRHVEWNDFEGPGEPLTGGATAIAGNLTSVATGVGGIPFKLATSARRRRKDEGKKEERKELMVKVKAEGKRVRSGSGQNGVTEKPKEEQANGRPQQQEAKDPNKGIARKDMLPGDQVPNEVARKPITQEGKQVQGGKAEAPENAGTQDEDATDADSILTAADGHDTAEEIVEDIAHGLCKSGGALIKTPMDLSTAVAQGFHNAPRLYGDTTVRRPTRITGMHSGLKAAGKEFIYGVYDGFTGLITQPYQGAVADGLPGCLKGVGMGLTGFVLKDLAAIFGPIAYTLKGVEKELEKGRQPTQLIRRARVIQGQRDFAALDHEAQKAAERGVRHGWNVMQEIWKAMADERGRGVKGCVCRFRERKTWRKDVEFDSVEMAEKALAALSRGDCDCLTAVVEKQRKRTEEERSRKVRRQRSEGRARRRETEEERRLEEMFRACAAKGICDLPGREAEEEAEGADSRGEEQRWAETREMGSLEGTKPMRRWGSLRN